VPDKKNNDSILRITAMVASVAVFLIGAIFSLDFKVQAVAMGFLLVNAAGTDPLELIEKWRKRK